MTGISTLGQSITNIRLINNQTTLLNSLSGQLSSGRKTQQFTGLGNDILASQRSRANVQQLDTYIDNITNGDRRISLTLQAIEEFQAQAENLANALITFPRESVHQDGDIVLFDDPLTPEEEAIQVGVNSADPDVDFQGLQNLARSLFGFLGDILNSQEADRFLLGGADSSTQPYNDSGTLDAAVSSLITRFKDETLPAGQNLTSSELVSALTSRNVSDDPNAVTDTIIGYSAALSAGNVGDIFVRVDERIEVEYTALANEQPFRDILVAAAFVGSNDLGPIADVYTEPFNLGDPTLADGAPGATIEEQRDNFFAVIDELTRVVNASIDDLDGVRFRLENSRARLDEVRQSHELDRSAFLNAIDDVENADINEVAIRLNSLQLQLEASFRVTASISQLSLVNFI